MSLSLAFFATFLGQSYPGLIEQVDSLQYATLATVSRCGMVWFSASEDGGAGSDSSANPGTVTNDMLLRHKVGC